MTFNFKEISTLDYFDSRDVVERLNEIRADEMAGMIPELRIERRVLEELLEKLENDMPTSFGESISTDTNCGVSGFAEHYAQEYAEEFAYDTGAVERGTRVEKYIDWEKAADDLKEDYTEVEILGHTFYLRD